MFIEVEYKQRNWSKNVINEVISYFALLHELKQNVYPIQNVINIGGFIRRRWNLTELRLELILTDTLIATKSDNSDLYIYVGAHAKNSSSWHFMLFVSQIMPYNYFSHTNLCR